MKEKNVDFLKRRAKEFWERAKEDFREKRYNLTALDVEQAIQLWIKYLIFIKAGDFPKTYYLNRLFHELSQVYDCNEIFEFYKKHPLEVRSIEDAYITSRYLPREFTEEEVENILKFAETIFKFLEEKINEKFI